MAVDDEFRGRRYGSALILKAFQTCLELETKLGFAAMIVDAKSEELVGYYEKHGFVALPENRRRLFIPVGSMKKIATSID